MLALMCMDKVCPYDEWYNMRLKNISIGGTLVVRAAWRFPFCLHRQEILLHTSI
jgi:hypothetical protein